MPKKARGSAPQKINVHDPAALAAAGFGNPGQQFNPEEELAASQMDASLVEGFNKGNKVNPEVPASAPVKGKKAGKTMPKKKAAPKPEPVAVVEEEETEEEEIINEDEEGEEDVLDLSEDPVERLNQVSKALAELDPSAPSPDQLGDWKQTHGDVFILYLYDKAFVYRYLKRAEWIKMNLDESFQNMRQDQIEDYIFDRCILWPTFSVIEKNKLPAGTIPALSEQIRINSMFVDPNRLSQLTVKL